MFRPNRKLVFGVLICLGVLISIAVFLFFNQSFSLRSSLLMKQFSPIINMFTFEPPVERINELNLRPVPYHVEWQGIVTGVSVSGLIEKKGIQKDKTGSYIAIKIPSESFTNLIHVYFADKQEKLLLLRVKDGQLGEERKWREETLENISSLLIPNRQVLVYVMMKKEDADKLPDVKRPLVSTLELKPIDRLILMDVKENE